ncbi:hypothetical protein M2388_002108 [Leucobacter aridicollis]|nr:hypothetical protein [Leucobacter aridicollis]
MVPVVSGNRIGANMFTILTESARGVGVPRRLRPARLARGAAASGWLGKMVG